MSDIFAGDILILQADNGEIGGFTYEQKSGSDLVVDAGGLTAEGEEDGITNAGNMIWRFTNKRGKITLEVSLNSEAHKYTVQTSRSKELTTYTVTEGNGETNAYIGRPVNKIEKNTQKGTASIEIHIKPVIFK